ncbi:MAG: hypothetical protein KJ626_00575 [Verrucomicrobia bacterium]|nr:hypothetical protein [Verrucomicrobiota bacterium]
MKLKEMDAYSVVFWTVLIVASVFAVFWLAGVRFSTDEAVAPPPEEPLATRSVISEVIDYEVSADEDSESERPKRKPPPPPLDDEFDPAPGENEPASGHLL